MIKETTFKVVFNLTHGFTEEAVIEDDGLALNDLREDIQRAINDDEYYILYDVVDDKWIVVKAKSIQSFSIKDLGKDGPRLVSEGFMFK